MSYRHTFYKEKELDFLIIDSEGMGSTTARYILRRTDFDKKMTLLGLMCSQVLIVNTKGLTRDISDTLEVSSYHLDALNNRDFNKPRISFVLRDMKDAKEAQRPAFLDIRQNLKKMFKEIPGCYYDMDDFMIVEERDVHLLENAFACSFDDFSKSATIDGENFHYPAETFPLKISKLRKELLDSALIPSENHESQIFKNVYGFITHMQAVWKEIDVRGNFLHFKDSKTIYQWSAMKKLVHSYNESTIKSYEENGLKLVEEHTSEGQWNENNDIAFETCLTQESEKFCTETIADFNEKISNQYEPQIIDEGETHIKAAFSAKKRELKAIYVKRQRQSKETWLIKSAEMRIGEAIGKILREHKDKTPDEFKNYFSESKCKELFNEEWEKAIENGRAIINNESNLKERLQFDRILWNKVSTPETLKKLEFLDETDKQFINIEFSQALEWLKILCNNIFIVQSNNFNNLHDQFKVKIDEFSLIEQYLRFKVFTALEKNTAKWKASQQNNLKILRENLSKYFNDILGNSSYENISSHFFKYVAKSVEKQLVIKEQNITEILESYLKQHWMSEERNPTRFAYEQSFGVYDIEKTRKYIRDPILFMKDLFETDVDIIKNIKVEERLEKIEKAINDALKKLGGIILNYQQHFSGSSEKDPPLEKIIMGKNNTKNIVTKIIQLFTSTSSESSNVTICPQSLIEDAICVLGKCIINSPQDFYKILEKDYNEYIQEFNTLWRSQRANLCKKTLIECIERSKESYWNKVKGCQYRCPYCGSKCELSEHEPNTNHRASIHLMNCFGGVRKLKTREASLTICNEPENFNITYFMGDDYENGLIFEKFTKKHYPEWWPLLGRKQPGDDQIKQVRAMWMNLKDELCSKYNMISI
ncbi:26708_t:CDS:2 [Dentiscutata erythropus]|uniref:26708_t:CDS:1 n=1 Tax=Dentiscutata erythropus TaxID=1348616 RepID=A0A9N9EKC6_9GLOM|nr:26708_t:CDS:2 [Dentiscutata erythropus]